MFLFSWLGFGEFWFFSWVHNNSLKLFLAGRHEFRTVFSLDLIWLQGNEVLSVKTLLFKDSAGTSCGIVKNKKRKKTEKPFKTKQYIKT